MINKTNFTYQSRDMEHKCMAYKWQSDTVPVKAVLQIVHGMQEHMNRYDELARFFCEQGFLVVGNDHLGHGQSVNSPDDLGYFAKKDADTIVVRDVHRLKKITESENPGKPYFILGHSMGSFIARKYLTMYGKGITGAIICGTGMQPLFVTGFGKFLSSFIGLFGKGRNESRFIEKVSFGAYNKRIPNASCTNDWVVRNPEVLAKYNEDPLSGFPFKTNGYHGLFSILHFVDKKKNLATIPKTLPIYVIAGLEDPVGKYGKDPKKVYEIYKELGIKDVSIKLYPDMRHEIFNDIERMTVYQDTLQWLNDRISSLS